MYGRYDIAGCGVHMVEMKRNYEHTVKPQLKVGEGYEKDNKERDGE